MVGNLILALQYLFKYILKRSCVSLLHRFRYRLEPIPALNADQRQHRVVISLTTYGRRLDNVDLTIRSLFKQTYKADVVVLNLAETEFSPASIPKSLKILQKHGLVINYTCDTRSYKKLIPTLALYPEDLIITVDDDVLYPDCLVAYLVDAYLKSPNMIHGFRGYSVPIQENTILPYEQWKKCVRDSYGKDIMLTGVGGILYWPGCFHPDIARQDLFMSLAPTADDLWFKAMTTLNNTPSHCVDYQGRFKSKFLSTSNSVIAPLNKKNKGQQHNDKMIKNLVAHYPELPQKINDTDSFDDQ